MSISIDYLGEPKLQFAQFFEHEDSKTGLAEFGPFGRSVPGLHPSEVRVGFVGTRETIASAREWLEECGREIESENVKRESAAVKGDLFGDQDLGGATETVRLEKILNRDFVGFNRSSPYACEFQFNDRWERSLSPRDVERILLLEDKQERIWKLVDLFDSAVEGLATTSPTPDIIVLALTTAMVDEAHAVRVSGNYSLNLRRALKARTMRWGIPTQLLQKSTAEGKARGRRQPLQEKATRAWNFCTAQYYKADGVPWRPVTVGADVCFVGISFYVAQDVEETLTLRASVAQAFDYLGQGLVLRGDPFEWDEDRLGRTPHLTKEGARRLIAGVMKAYVDVRGNPPSRVVIHKSSEFWGSDHGEHDELEGLYQGIDEVFPRCETDFLTLRQSGVRLFREGMYPPLRGTHACLEGTEHFLYTMGFIPYLETYPGSYVPEPWHLAEHHGGGAAKDLLREVLCLTKMNVNNCAFADGRPITLSFAKMIGEIMRHIPEDGIVQPQYRFYM